MHYILVRFSAMVSSHFDLVGGPTCAGFWVSWSNTMATVKVFNNLNVGDKNTRPPKITTVDIEFV